MFGIFDGIFQQVESIKTRHQGQGAQLGRGEFGGSWHTLHSGTVSRMKCASPGLK